MSTPHGLSPEDQKIADMIAGLAYRTPPRDLSARIMARIAPHQPLWRRAMIWLLTPQPLRITPLWPASALAVMAILGVFTASMSPRDREADFRATRVAEIEPSTEQTVRVEFSIRVDGAEDVELIGSFNNWKSQGYRMTPNGRDGTWTISIPLPRGHHEYAFNLDRTRIVPDPAALLHKDDGFGNINSIIMVDEHALPNQS